MGNFDLHYKKIIESVKLLSISNSEDVLSDFFQAFEDIPFEIMDTYLNAFLLSPELIENEYFSFANVANLIRLNNLISIFLIDPNIQQKEMQELLECKQWLIIMGIAKEILKELDIPSNSLPDKNFI